MALLDDPYNSSLVNFGSTLAVKGIVCVSSHWIVPGPIQVSANPTPMALHNFHGYQKEIYDLTYRPPYSADLVQQVAGLVDEAGFEVTLNPQHGFDHGVWMPLRLLCPEANLPVVQLSLPLYEDHRMILKLGHALSLLREKGILLLGSGMAAFNAGKLVWHARGSDVHPKIAAFDDWLEERLLGAHIEDILDYRTRAPHGEFAHPSSAGLLPLFFTIGTSLHGDRPQILYKGFKYSTTSLLSFCLSSEDLTHRSFS
jgi:4,5-DOPA dioxygenase extradiol